MKLDYGILIGVLNSNGVKELVKSFSKSFGMIERVDPITINGKQGFLIWDYVLYNEITFVDENDNHISMFTSISDSKTEAEFKRILRNNS